MPTMKYWKTLLLVSPPRFMYLLKLGILVERAPVPPLKGLSNDEVLETSVTLRFCREALATRTAGNCWRAQVRASVLAVEVSAGIVREDRGVGDAGGGGR